MSKFIPFFMILTSCSCIFDLQIKTAILDNESEDSWSTTPKSSIEFTNGPSAPRNLPDLPLNLTGPHGS